MSRKIEIHYRNSKELSQVLSRILQAVGYSTATDQTIESMIEILRDKYDIQISVVQKPLTIQEFALSKMDELAKAIELMSANIKQVQGHKNKQFFHDQQKHFNQTQNVRIKKYANFHKNKQR